MKESNVQESRGSVSPDIHSPGLHAVLCLWERWHAETVPHFAVCACLYNLSAVSIDTVSESTAGLMSESCT